MKNLHHAYVIEGERERALKDLFKFLEKDLNFNTQGNPDFWHASFETFGIEEGRELKEMQSKKSFAENGKKVFVVSLNFITIEAQNSLLKVFEEPTEGTHFFLIVPSVEIFIPTVRSRVSMLSLGSDDIHKEDELVNKFVSYSPTKRIEILNEIIENKDKNLAIKFLNKLEDKLYNLFGEKIDKKNKEIFEQIIVCRGYLNDRSPSVKMILEHIALVTPVFVS